MLYAAICHFTPETYTLHNSMKLSPETLNTIVWNFHRKHTLYTTVCNFTPEIYTTQYYVTSQSNRVTPHNVALSRRQDAENDD